MTQALPDIRTRPRRGAFTLIELLVSLAVLSIALTIVGVVFSAATSSAQKTAALADRQRWLQQFADELQADLRAIDPARSFLMLVGREQAAALTDDDFQAGLFYRVLTADTRSAAALDFDPEIDALDATSSLYYRDPRADLIAFITQRPTASAAPPLDMTGPGAEFLVSGGKFSPVLTVYGHAALGRRDFSSIEHIERLTPTDVSPIPAVDWQLARRATILLPGNDIDFSGIQDNIIQCRAEDDISGDAVFVDTDRLLAALNPYPVSLNRLTGLALSDPYDFPSGDWSVPGLDVADVIYEWIYAGGNDANHHFATLLQEPPAEYRTNLSMQALPGCVDFKVEFLMPEDPRNSSAYVWPIPGVSDVDPNDADFDDYAQRWDPVRWTEIEPGETYFFVPDTAANRSLIEQAGGGRLSMFARLNPHTGAGRVIRTWPYAIRITVRVMDATGQLSEPLERTIVHRFR